MSDSTRLNELRELLYELFQIDEAAELDFGIYRIMAARRDEVKKFLDDDLLPQVETLLQKQSGTDLKKTEEQLQEALEQARKLGADDPETLPAVQQLRDKLKLAGSSVQEEDAVFSALTQFFKRYYHNGDFLSLRRYKPGVYAIPYEGEEVKLHWANADQYYIKTAEHFSNYTFLAGTYRVHFNIIQAETEKDNVKAEKGKERRFALFADEPIIEQNGEPAFQFTYSIQEERQDVLSRKAVEWVKKNPAKFADKGWQNILLELLRPAPTEKNKERTVLEKHLTQYTARNTFDYFIHKDLGGFLRRELDFYIKNEILFIDDIDARDEAGFVRQLGKIKTIKAIGQKIIDFLEQLENFQKKLFLKKKFVVESNWCMTLDRVPKELWEEVRNNAAQVEEWKELFAIHDNSEKNNSEEKNNEPVQEEIFKTEIEPFSNPPSLTFLEENQFLPVDTIHFEKSFVETLLTTIEQIDEQKNGVLVHGDNLQGLNLLHKRYEKRIKFIYIDPPYNTGDDDSFVYKDNFQSSSWLSMMLDRLALGREWQHQEGIIAVSIDDIEVSRLKELMRLVYGENELAALVWDKNRKNDAKFFSVGHEYMHVFAYDKTYLKSINKVFREPKEGLETVEKIYRRIEKKHGENYEKIKEEWKSHFDNIPKSDPKSKLSRYNKIGSKGPYRDDGNISWPGGGGPRYEVIHPITKKSCKIPSRGWVFPTVERFWEEYDKGRIVFGEDESTVPRFIMYLFDSDGQVMPSVFYSYAQTAAQEYKDIFGTKNFENPKNWRDIYRLVNYVGDSKQIVLDYFGGSGTTAHSVIQLNHDDKGDRKYVLIEMGHHFDTVIKPRIKKIIYCKDWENGKPLSRDKGSSHCFQYLRLESYEDTLNNLQMQNRDAVQQQTLDEHADFREDYMLRYMLDVESQESLLSSEAFQNPFNRKMRIQRNGEIKEQTVDLVETFNWLIGLRVQTRRRTRNFIEITGIAPDEARVLIIWRNCEESDNKALDKFFSDMRYNPKDREFDRIYVNGDNNLENQKTNDDRWKVILTEEEFLKRMFENC